MAASPGNFDGASVGVCVLPKAVSLEHEQKFQSRTGVGRNTLGTPVFLGGGGEDLLEQKAESLQRLGVDRNTSGTLHGDFSDLAVFLEHEQQAWSRTGVGRNTLGTVGAHDGGDGGLLHMKAVFVRTGVGRNTSGTKRLFHAAGGLNVCCCFREVGCPESLYSGPLAEVAVKGHEMDDLQCMCLRGRYGRCTVRAARGQQLCRACHMGGPTCQCGCVCCDDGEDREASSGGGPAEKATAPSTETCERKEHDSPKSYRKAGAQHAVEEYGRRELEDREPPESFREAGCPESFCSGTVAKHAVKEHGYSDLQECESSAGFGETFASEPSWSADGANFGSRGVFLVNFVGRFSVGRVQGPAVLCCRLNPICA
jgi:hypothetical protein